MLLFKAFQFCSLERRKPSIVRNIQKSNKNQSLSGRRFFEQRIFFKLRQKRSKSFWIYEYFNNRLVKIRIQKTVSDYTRQLKGMILLRRKEIAEFAVEQLKLDYPEAICSLDAENPVQLIIATRLSAQCTDARVNLVTPKLFEKYPTLEDYAAANIEDVEDIVRPCGFYHMKARDIVGMAQMILDEYGGVVPDTIDELVRLPGVGRKTANLIVGDVYKKPAVVADTHLIRISNRLGLVNTKDPYKVEMELKKLLPPEESNDFCHRCVLHGRAVCDARKPKCDVCNLKQVCKYANN